MNALSIMTRRPAIVMFRVLVLLAASSQSFVNADSGSDNARGPFWITRVTKTEGRLAYEVRVEYEADTKPQVYQFVRGGFTTEVTEGHAQLGVVVVQFRKNSSGARLFFFCKHLGLVIVQLNLTSSSASMEVPRIHTHVQQGSDISFQHGGNIQMDLSFLVDGSFKTSHIISNALVKSNDEENMVQRYNIAGRNDMAPVMFIPVRVEGVPGNMNATVLLAPTGGRQDVEGLLNLEFITEFSCSSNCLVSSVQTPLKLRFYREDHTGPFPPGFIGFVRDAWVRSQIYCGYGRGDDLPCYVSCEIAGDHPQDIQLSRLGSNPDDDPAHADILTMIGDFEATAYVLVDRSQGDGDFLCTARSSTREINKTISVNFVMYPKIDRELSVATRFQNGSIRATCVATGRPAPTVGFFQSSVHHRRLSPDDYDVTVTHVDESTTRAELFMPASNVTVAFVDCTATNNPEVEDHFVINSGSLPSELHYYLHNVVIENDARSH